MAEETALNVRFTGDSQDVITAARTAGAAVDQFGDKVSVGTKRQHDMNRAARDGKRDLESLGRTVGAVTGLLASLGVATIAQKFKEVAVESDKLKGSLKTVTGSSEAAAVAFASLEKFAAKTPFALDQSVTAFIRMKSLGLDPTERALTSFGNTASAMGKDLLQMVEAVADATTGEFERLKAFGIKAKQEGDNVSLTFQGVTTTIGKNAGEITEYLTRIGEVNFGSAMADQMVALPGLFSNLEDSINGVFRTLADLGGASALGDFVRGLTDDVQDFDESLPSLIQNVHHLENAILTLGAFAIARTAVPAMSAFAAAVSGAGLSLATFGGPAGFVIVAATALAAFTLNTREASVNTKLLTNDIAVFRAEFEELTKAQKDSQLLKWSADLLQVRDAAKQTLDEIIQARENFNSAMALSTDPAQSPAQQSMFGAEALKAAESLTHLRAKMDELREAEAKLTRVMDDTRKGVVIRDAVVKDSGNVIDTFTAGLISAVEDQAKAFATQDEAIKKSVQSFNEANDPLVKFQERLKEINALTKAGGVTDRARANAIIAASEAYAKAANAGGDYAEMLKEGKRLTEDSTPPLEKYTAQVERLGVLLKEGVITPEVFQDQVKKGADALAGANIQAAEASTTAWQTFGQSVSEAFRDTFIQAEGSLDDFLKRAESALKEAARRWLFDSTIGRLFGGGVALGASNGAAASVSGGGGGGGGITGLLGGNYSSLATGSSLAALNGGLATGAGYLINGLNAAGFTSAAGGVGTYFGQTAALGNSVGGSVGIAGGPALGGLVQAGAGIAGNYVGNQLGQAVFDKQAESNIGGTIGAAGGAYLGAQYGSTLGPYGTVIGAALGGIIGALADVAFGGDGKKRTNIGSIVGPTVTGGTVGASGLRIASYDRRGDDKASNALTTALVDIDAILTGVAKNAGVKVDFSNTALRGRNPDAGHDGEGIFFGGKGFNGGIDGFKEAPEEFVRAWIAEINDQLPKRVRDFVGGVTGAAQELVTAFAAAVEIDNLLNLDVVKDTKKATEELLKPQKKLLELYDETTKKVMDLTAEFNGSGASLAVLSESLRQQKIAAVELALAYQGVKLESDTLFADASKSIREALLSPEELYESRRAQIAALTQQLSTTTSPDEIARLNREIVGLTNDAFRSLAPDQQQTLGAEFLAFLEDARRISQTQLDAGIASLASREEAIQRAIDLELSAASTTAAAATTLQTAATTFATWADRLTNGGAQITINIPGVGAVQVPLGFNLSEVTL